MKRILAIAATAGLILAVAPPAAAQTNASASLGGVSNNQAVAGYVNLVAKGSHASGISRIEIQVNGSTIRSQNYGGLQTSQTLSHTWDTRHLANGQYTLKSRVIPNIGAGQAGEATVRVLLNNPAATPTGVSAGLSGNSVVVSWNKNSEPDIQSYIVERDSGGGWRSAGSTSATSLTDNPGPGKHSYRVSAVRSSPTNGSNTSAPSGAASVSVPQPTSASGGGSKGGTRSSGSGSGSGGGKMAGYGGGKGSKKGKAGSGGGVYGGIGVAGGRRLGSLGLPGRLRIPGRAGATRAEIAGVESGVFEETLPYNLPDGIKVTEEVPGGLNRIAAVTARRVIPPDGLRWVAAGLLLIVTSMLLLFLERRLARRERATEAAVEPTGAPVAPTIDVVAENIAAHAARETRFVDAVAANMAPSVALSTSAVTSIPAATLRKTSRQKTNTARRAGRTTTAKETARKQTAAERAAATANRPAKADRQADRKARRSHKTTTARKAPRAGGRRIRASKEAAERRADLRLVETDSTAA